MLAVCRSEGSAELSTAVARTLTSTTFNPVEDLPSRARESSPAGHTSTEPQVRQAVT
jgi:hypothetical protein